MSETLVCVDPDTLDRVWPHVAHFIEAAFARGNGDEDAITVKADLDARRALLWVVWDGNSLIAAASTKIIDVPKGRLCVITACGGRELPRWQRFIGDLERYAKTEGCTTMRVMGRPGWTKILDGYQQPWVCLDKDLR